MADWMIIELKVALCILHVSAIIKPWGGDRRENNKCNVFFFKVHLKVQWETISYRIHLKVDQFTARQSDYNLSLIHGAFNNRLFARCFPLVDTLVGTNVTDTVGINLEKLIR